MSMFLWVLFAFFVFVVLLLLTPVHAEITYHADGFLCAIRIFFLRFRFPREKKKDKREKVAPNETNQKQKGGDLNYIISLIRLGIKLAGKLLSNVRIRKLKIDATIASKDPFQTAMMFGGSSAAVGILLPLIENNFKLDKRTVNVYADFESDESKLVLFADCSVLVFHLIAIALCFAYNLWKNPKMKTSVKRKDDLHGRTKSE